MQARSNLYTQTWLSTHRQCAERRALDYVLLKARRGRIPPHRKGAFIRKQIGTLEVTSISGLKETTRPCVFCCAALSLYGIRVQYKVNGEIRTTRADLIRGCVLKTSDNCRFRDGIQIN